MLPTRSKIAKLILVVPTPLPLNSTCGSTVGLPEVKAKLSTLLVSVELVKNAIPLTAPADEEAALV